MPAQKKKKEDTISCTEQSTLPKGAARESKGSRPGLRQCLHSSEPQFINQQDSSPGVPSQLQNSRLTMGYLLLLPNEQN